MNAKHSLSMSRRGLLVALLGVALGSPLGAQELWREGRNIGGLAFCESAGAEALIGGEFTSGGLRTLSEAPELWGGVVRAQAESHYKDLVLTGHFSFQLHSGKQMMGSMFTEPGYYPVDVLEFTPGQKTRQTYGIGGGLAWLNSSRWIPGATVRFQGVNYSKRKDLRHTTYRQEVEVAPSLLYAGNSWHFGVTGLFEKTSEFIQAEQLGAATAESYYAFLDLGMRFGNYQVWDGSGIHLSEAGVDRFAVKEYSYGGALQASYKDRFYADVEYTRSRGLVGEKGYTWYRFPGQALEAKLLGAVGGHTFGLEAEWRQQSNRESVIERVTAGGVTTPSEYGSNPIFERRSVGGGPSWSYESEKGWSLSAEAEVEAEAAQSTLMYPYVATEQLTVFRLLLEGAVPLGPFEIEAGLGLRGALGEHQHALEIVDPLSHVVSVPFQLEEWHELEHELEEALCLRTALAIRYNFTLARKAACYVQASCQWDHAFKVELLPGANRQITQLSLGYNF